MGVVLTDNGSTIPGKPTDATTLNGLLVYLGYQSQSGEGLSANHLESIESFLLMPQNEAEFNVLDFASGQHVGKHLSLKDSVLGWRNLTDW